jgi:hypothetical protein
VTQEDVCVVLEVFLSQYFKLGRIFPFIISNNFMSNGHNADSADLKWLIFRGQRLSYRMQPFQMRISLLVSCIVIIKIIAS